jgi:hypothetical protein
MPSVDSSMEEQACVFDDMIICYGDSDFHRVLEIGFSDFLMIT